MVEVNTTLPDSPDQVNADPESSAWFVKLRIADPTAAEALMDRPAYEQFLQGL